MVAALLAAALGLPKIAVAASLGNLTYTQDELEKPVSFFGGDGANKFPSGPNGSNTVLMLHGYMVVMGSYDSGKPPGSFHVYDITDPRKPVHKHTFDGTPETANIRELHAMPIAKIDGKDFLVVPTTTGLQFFDFTDPLAPKASGSLKLTGVNAGDYDNAAWMVSWAWPYVYVGGTGNGVYIVDATNPAAPVELKRITSPEVGNFRVGPVYAAGNYLIAAQMDQATTHFSVLDVGDPKKPFLLSTGQTADSLYSALVIGDHIYGAGTNGSYAFLKWNIDSVSVVKRTTSGTDRGGYCGYTDGFVLCGQSSEGYKKFDARDDANINEAGHGTDPEAEGGDFDFATPLGNLVYLGNDHGSGAALIPHSMAADTVPPKVLNVYPAEGDVKQPLTSRMTAYFSDDIDLDSVNEKNLIVRKNGDCTPLAGVFSKSSFNAISFGAKQPLLANSTYIVIVPAGGLRDLAGNAVQVGRVSHFSTGTTAEAVVACPSDGDVTSPGGQGGTGAGGAAGAGAGGTAGMGGSAAGTPATGGAGAAGAAGMAGAMPAGTGGSGGAPTVIPAGGTAAVAFTPADPAGCGCTVPGQPRFGAAGLFAAGIAGLAVLRGLSRRRRKLASSS